MCILKVGNIELELQLMYKPLMMALIIILHCLEQ
jgi:hypothetical protein